MTVIRSESFTEIYGELLPLFELHWADLGVYKDKMPLAPRVAAYAYLESIGELLTLTARQDGELVGYFNIRIGPRLHYERTIEALTDLPYVHPKIRGRGVGVRLFLAAQEEIKSRNVDIWLASSKLVGPLHKSMDRVLTWLGMTPTDVQYSKWMS